jgi:hypothetical protein
MSEFCSQSRAPIAAIGKKITTNKCFPLFGYSARNRNGVIQLAGQTPEKAALTPARTKPAEEYGT